MPAPIPASRQSTAPAADERCGTLTNTTSGSAERAATLAGVAAVGRAKILRSEGRCRIGRQRRRLAGRAGLAAVRAAQILRLCVAGCPDERGERHAERGRAGEAMASMLHRSSFRVHDRLLRSFGLHCVRCR